MPRSPAASHHDGHDAAYHLVPGAGHMVNMEQPAAINDLLISFVQEASWTR